MDHLLHVHSNYSQQGLHLAASSSYPFPQGLHLAASSSYPFPHSHISLHFLCCRSVSRLQNSIVTTSYPAPSCPWRPLRYCRRRSSMSGKDTDYTTKLGTERRCLISGLVSVTRVEASMEETKLEMFELGPCADAYDLGFQIGRRFSGLIKSRVHSDPILRHQLLPFAATPHAQPILQAFFNNNREKFPNYWDELVGTAAGSGVSVLEILLLNFRKEILPFIPDDTPAAASNLDHDDPSSDCSDILIAGDNIAMVAHNEDANVALIGHTYLVKVALPSGHSFTAYTYAGELPSCAFGFNSHGLAFTLDSVPPLKEEIQVGGIGRNLISRGLLEATSLEDALRCIRSCNPSVGHSYNLVDVRTREVANVETASRHRVSVRMIGNSPSFHANMYLHLQVQQVQDENSISRQKRAAMFSAMSEEEMLTILGDCKNEIYPIYMRGPKLYTLCTAVIDLDKRTVSIIHGNPGKEGCSRQTFNIVEKSNEEQPTTL